MPARFRSVTVGEKDRHGAGGRPVRALLESLVRRVVPAGRCLSLLTRDVEQFLGRPGHGSVGDIGSAGRAEEKHCGDRGDGVLFRAVAGMPADGVQFLLQPHEVAVQPGRVVTVVAIATAHRAVQQAARLHHGACPAAAGLGQLLGDLTGVFHADLHAVVAGRLGLVVIDVEFGCPARGLQPGYLLRVVFRRLRHEVGQRRCYRADEFPEPAGQLLTDQAQGFPALVAGPEDQVHGRVAHRPPGPRGVLVPDGGAGALPGGPRILQLPHQRAREERVQLVGDGVDVIHEDRHRYRRERQAGPGLQYIVGDLAHRDPGL